MKKLLNWIEDEKWYLSCFRYSPIALIISLVTITSYAAAKATKVYMRDKNLYFVLDVSKDNFLNMNPMGEIANMFFGFHKGIIKSISWLIEQSYTFDLYQLIEKQFNTLFEPIKNTFWNGFFPIAGGIFILSLLLLITFHGRASTAFEGFVKGMAIITFALWFMRAPADSMSGLKNVTDGVNAELVKNSYSEVKVEDQYKEISDQFYTTFVVEIWRILNFGAAGFDNEDIKNVQIKYETKLLNAAPGTEEREKLSEELREEVKISEASWIGSLLLIMILSIPDIIIMVLFSGINLASDVFTVGLALMGPIIFLFAIVPNYGSRLFMSWLSKILFFFAITVATTIAMTYYIGLTNILLSSRTQLGGIIGVFVVKDAILIVAYIFRDKFIFAAQSAAQGRRGMERSMDQMSFKQETLEGKNRVVDKAKKGAEKTTGHMKSTVKKIKDANEEKHIKARTSTISKPLVMSVNEKTELAEEALEARLKHRMTTAQNEAVEKEEKFGIKFEPDYGDLTEHVKRYEAGEDPFTGAERRIMVNDIEKHEKAFGDPREFVDKYKVDFARMDSDQRRVYSEDYLRKRFEDKKELAENEAKENGKPPRYDDWTRERIERSERGESLFTEKEVDTFSEKIRRSEKSGENVQKTLKHKARKTTDNMNPDDEEHESSSRRPESTPGTSGKGAVHNNSSAYTNEDINVNHNHRHDYNVHYDEHSRNTSDQTVDIKKVRTTGIDKGGSIEIPTKQSGVNMVDIRVSEATLRGINEVIKNQHEEKKDIDETQEQLKEIQKNVERRERNINAKINKLEGERAEEEKEEE